MESLENEWKKINPDQPFVYSFLDQSYNNLYKSERKTGTFILVFCFFAVIVSCIGLFSLVSLLAQTRRKEIGIRKVLGASVTNAIFILIHEYMILIAATNIIAAPIVYYLMNNWLNNFIYRIQINVWIFIVAGLSTLIIALLTIIFQVAKAATASPVISLKYE